MSRRLRAPHALAAAAAAISPVGASPQAPRSAPPRLQSAPAAAGVDTAWVDRTVRAELAAMRAPGGAVGIVVGGRVVYAKGYGRRSVEGSEPVTAGTLFRIGSTTKMFTGLTALLLAGDGTLALDRPVGTYARGLSAPLARVTMRQLLSHTAGLTNEAAGDGPHDDSAVARRVGGWAGEHVLAEPGDVYSYSGPGYWLAGHVLAEAAGRPYADLVEARVLRPAGMTRSTFRPLVALTHPLALDHRVVGDSARVVRPFPDDVTTWPSGSLFSSADELARFAALLLGGAGGAPVFPAAAVRQMARPVAAQPGGSCGYAFGLSVCAEHGLTTLSHAGFRGGTGSLVTLVPSAGVAVVLLSNRNGGIPFRSSRTLLAGLVPALARDSPSDDGGSTTGASAPPDAAVAGAYVNGRDTLRVVRAPGGALEYRYGAQTARAVANRPPGTLSVLDSAGAEAQRFLFVRGRRGGSWYLHDGLNAFARLPGREGG